MQLLLLETFIFLVTHFDTVPANAGIIYMRFYMLVSPSSLLVWVSVGPRVCG